MLRKNILRSIVCDSAVVIAADSSTVAPISSHARSVRPNLPAAEALFRRFADGSPTEADLRQMLDHWAVKDEARTRANQPAARWKGKLDDSPSVDVLRVRYPDEWKEAVGVCVRQSIRDAPTTKQMKRILGHLDKCPALRAGTRADFYITWRIATGRQMQHDRWDDLRHCINSAYADLFVTRDAALKAAFTQVRPGPRVVTVAEFGAILGIPYSGP